MNALTKSVHLDNSLPIAEPNTLVRSFDLISFRYLPKLGEMICVVRDRATRAIKQALGSSLHIYSGDKDDTYLLELVKTGGNQ